MCDNHLRCYKIELEGLGHVTTAVLAARQIYYVPARFVSQATAFALILTATHDVANQSLSAVQAPAGKGEFVFLARLVIPRRRCVAATSSCCCCCCRRRPSCNGRLDQRPAPADPVAVASIHKLVSATREPTLGGILARGQPRDESWNIKVSEKHRSDCQSACAASCHRLTGRAKEGGLA